MLKRFFSRYDKQIIKTSVNMAIPAIIESFFIAFAGLVDSCMVSSLGHEAVAAVGLTAQPKFLGLSIFIAFNVAISALVARRLGEKKQDEANGIMLTSAIVIMLLALVLGCVFVFFASPIISFCGSTSDTHDSAVLYYRIIMGAMIFDCLQRGLNSAQRGAGNTKITMRTNITSNSVNILFNFLLINGRFGFPALGIAGAALATVLGSVVACIMSILSLTKHDGFLSFRYIFTYKIRPAFVHLKNVISVGYSVFFEQLLMRVGFMLTAIMAAHQGTASMAAHQVGMNLLGLSFAFGDGLQAAAVALIGRSLGEKNHDRARSYGQTCQMIGGVISVFVAIFYFLGARLLMSMFFDEPEIIQIGVNIVYVVVFAVLFQVRQAIYMGCLRGAGDTLYTTIVSTIGVTIIRTGFSYLGSSVLSWGIVGIWLGILADQISRYTLSSIRFKKGKWVNIKI